MTMEELRKLADKLVKIAMDFYKNENNDMALYALLNGWGNYKVEAFPEAGHNRNVVLEAIYKYANRNKPKEVEKIFEHGLLKCARLTAGMEGYNNTCEYIILELENEKKGESPFKIDMINILNELKKKIQTLEILESDENFRNFVSQREEYISKNYNL